MTDERDGEYWKIIKQSYKRQNEGAIDEDLTDRQFIERVQGMTEAQKARLQRDANDLFDEKCAEQNRKLELAKSSNSKSKSDTKKEEGLHNLENDLVQGS